MEDKRSEGVGIILVSVYILVTSFLVFMPMFLGIAISPGGSANTLTDHLFDLCANIMIFSLFLTFISAIGLCILKNWARKLIVLLLPLNSILYLCFLFLQRSINETNTIVTHVDVTRNVMVLSPLLCLIYLTRPKVKEIFKKTTIESGMMCLGIFDLMWSLSLFMIYTSNRYQISSILLCIFCLISGIGIMKRKLWLRRIFLIGVVPLTTLTLLNIILFGKSAAPEHIYSEVVFDLVPFAIVFLIFPAFFNFYVLTRPAVKGRFK